MMGPLSVKAQVQSDAGRLKNQLSVVAALNDEARKKQMHQLKLAKEMAKAKAEGLPIEGFSDGILELPQAGSVVPPTTLKNNKGGSQQPSHGVTVPPIGHSGPSVTLKNPEAGPTDVVPAMLTPGEAVIPASIAQDSNFKPVIAALVNAGRKRNDVMGFADGTLEVPDNWDELLERQRLAESAGKHKLPDGTLTRSPKGALGVAQIMPATAKDPGFGVAPLANDSEEEHRRFQGDYMKALLQKYKDPGKAFAAYNMGPGNMDSLISKYGDDWKSNLNPETAGYLPKIFGNVPTTATSVSATDRVGTERGRRTNTGTYTPEMGQELETLKRFIENPGTDANSRGKARLRLAELERARGNATMPALERNYQGVSKPAGASARPGATVTTSPSLVPVPQTLKRMPPIDSSDRKVIDSSDRKVTTVDAQQWQQENSMEPGGNGVKIPKSMQPTAQAFEQYMYTPEVQKALESLEANKPTGDVDLKQWLANGLAKIFGDKGFFNNEDLMRFSLLAAGGLLTGGSVGGSLRYAGLHTLSSRDKRKDDEQTQAFQQAQAVAKSKADAIAKLQTSIGQHESKFMDLMKKATPEAKGQAHKLFEMARKEPDLGRREAILQDANRVLANDQEDSDAASRTQSGYDAISGAPTQYKIDKEGNTWVHDPEKGVMVKTNRKVMSVSDFHDTRKAIQEDAYTAIHARLNHFNRREDGSVRDKNTSPQVIESYSKNLALATMDLLPQFGYAADPKRVAVVVDHALQMLPEQYRGAGINNLSREAWARFVMGATLVDSRETNRDLYKAGTPNGRPGLDATTYLKEVMDMAKQNGAEPGEWMNRKEAQFKQLPDAQKKDWINRSKSDTGKEWSPFLLWLKFGQGKN
ncbi:MAG TPA: transglycosylase SLT domain-containing protein [Mesotoga sp.]|nr:transglycosylase SLT domain-containing protein [Mesotoga sp.]